MKFDCGETWDEKKTRLQKWHRHYALIPRMVSDHDCRWLEYIERKGKFIPSWYESFWIWEYRALKDAA